jgi:RimJ/RimL family protein N-acetyltransferase
MQAAELFEQKTKPPEVARRLRLSPKNEASAKTMIAAGMVEEGTIREHIRKAGKWRDSVVHSMLDHEWRDLQPSAS